MITVVFRTVRYAEKITEYLYEFAVVSFFLMLYNNTGEGKMRILRDEKIPYYYQIKLFNSCRVKFR